MTDQGSEQAVVVSAVIVSGIYFYRKLTDPALGRAVAGPLEGSGGRAVGALFGSRTGAVAPLGRWLLGFSVSFMIIAVLAAIDPGLGGWLAILLATGSVLTNGMAIATDINHKTA